MAYVQHMSSKIVAGAVLLLSLFLLQAQPVAAAEQKDSLTLSPATLHVDLMAGVQTDGTFKVINDGDVAYDFTVYAAPYTVKNEAYDPDFSVYKDSSELYKWVSFPRTSWHTEPHQTIEVPFSIVPSKGAASGGYFGALFVETKAGVADATGVVRKKRLGLVLYTKIEGQTEVSGKAERFATPWLQTTAPLESSVWIDNTGKTDFTATTRMTVRDVFGKTLFTSDGKHAVIPNKTRRADHQWAEAPWIGIVKVNTEATVLGKTTSSETLVVITPVWFLLLVGLVSLLGVANAMRRVKRTSRRSNRR